MESPNLGHNDNDKNIDFYNNIGVAPFKSMAEKGGFDNFIDLEVAYEYFKDSKTLVELGAGYGRCLEFLISKQYSGKIYAVEYSSILAEHLVNQYSANATILELDIKKLQLPTAVDVALWMWSGFIDFTPDEQQHSVQLVYNQLNNEGKLLIDVPRFGVQTIANHSDEQHIHFQTSYGSLNCFIPNFENISHYAQVAGFESVKMIDYKTETQKERSLYILFKA